MTVRADRRGGAYVLASALLFGLYGCAGDPFQQSTTGSGGAAGHGGSGSSSSGGGGHGVSCDGAPGALSLGGVWAAKVELAVSLTGADGGVISVCPPDQASAATLLMMVSITQDEVDKTKLSMVRTTVCSLDFPTVEASLGACDPMSKSLVKASFDAPPALVAALPTVASALSGGTLSGLAPGASLDAGPFAMTIGATTPPDAMPSWDQASSACGSLDIGHTTVCEAACVACGALSDDDADGYPGVSIAVCGATDDEQAAGKPCHADAPDDPGVTLQGRAFVDLGISPVLHGDVASWCEVKGKAGATWRYNVVGADVTLAGASLGVGAVAKSLPMFHVDEDAGTLKMTRVDGRYGAPDWEIDAMSPAAACQTILQRFHELP